MADEEQSGIEDTCAQPAVVNRYIDAAKIANGVLKEVKAKCVAGAKIIEICAFGDGRIEEETGKIFKKNKELKKGIAFPTCLSVNHVICHYSPVASDTPVATLADGDLVKIDLGAHIDGFIAVVATTLVIGATKDNPATGRKADVILAAHNAMEAALRVLKPGVDNYQVTDIINKVAQESFKANPIEGMLSHGLGKHVIDGAKAIIQNPTDPQRKEHEKCVFEVHEVYALDILISSGAGKGKESEAKTTVHKKKELVYNLKMKSSKQFLSEAEKKYGLMPFTLRAFESESRARLALKECVAHDVIEPFRVLQEKDGEFVAQFKCTVLLMPSGNLKITGLDFEPELYKSEHSVKDETIKALLATSLVPKKKKKKKAQAAVAEQMAATSDP